MTWITLLQGLCLLVHRQLGGTFTNGDMQWYSVLKSLRVLLELLKKTLLSLYAWCVENCTFAISTKSASNNPTNISYTPPWWLVAPTSRLATKSWYSLAPLGPWRRIPWCLGVSGGQDGEMVDSEVGDQFLWNKDLMTLVPRISGSIFLILSHLNHDGGLMVVLDQNWWCDHAREGSKTLVVCKK